MSRRATTWVAATVGVAVVASAVVFLSLQTLEEADRWSSVGAFLASLITVVVSAIGWVSTRDAPSQDATGHQRWGWRVINLFNGLVINGPGTRNEFVYRDGRPVLADQDGHGRLTSAKPEAAAAGSVVDGVDRSDRPSTPVATRRPRSRRRSRKR